MDLNGRIPAGGPGLAPLNLGIPDLNSVSLLLEPLNISSFFCPKHQAGSGRVGGADAVWAYRVASRVHELPQLGWWEPSLHCCPLPPATVRCKPGGT